jgi:1-acyl-sn-glycerol-3-phosphate acyltransferase
VSRLHRPKAGFWIRLCVAIIYPLVGTIYKLRWRGLDRVPAPEAGGVIIAVNHLSVADTGIMARAVWQSGRIPRFLIKAGVFEWAVVGRIMSGAGQIPVHRGTTDAAQSLREAAAALERGEAVVIYPEGTTTKDPTNWPMQAKTGIARLVLMSPDTPVVPIGQWGPHKIRPLSVKRLGRRRTSFVSVGEPLDFSKYRDEPASQTLMRRITDEIMAAVRDEVASVRGETPPEKFFVPTRRYVDKRTS